MGNHLSQLLLGVPIAKIKYPIDDTVMYVHIQFLGEHCPVCYRTRNISIDLRCISCENPLAVDFSCFHSFIISLLTSVDLTLIDLMVVILL